MTAMYRIRLRPEAETDLRLLYQGLLERGTPLVTARAYINRILVFVNGLDLFPKRGRVRDEIRQGLRVIGFEHRVSIAFVVEDESREVVVLRILYGGQELRFGDE